MTTSMAKLEEIVAETWAVVRELAESQKETERVLKESSAEWKAEMAEWKAEWRAEVDAWKIEADRRSAEADRRSAEADRRSAEADRHIAELKQLSVEADKRIAKLEQTVETVTRRMGGLNNSIGEIVEMVVIPGVMGKMNAFKHNFTEPPRFRREFQKANGETLTEVDLLLESREAIVAVEVKSHLTVSRVDWHLERMRLLRKNERSTGMEGRAMYAAVAGIRIDEAAYDLAKENGMYVISIGEDADRVRIEAPDEAMVW